MAAAARLSASFLPLFFYGHNNDTVLLTFLPRLLNELTSHFPDHAFLRLDHYAAFWRQRLDRLANWQHSSDQHNVAVIRHQRPDVVTVNGLVEEKIWPFSLAQLLQSPLSILGEGIKKPRLRDRVADRFELETVLPISALSLTSHQGWKSVGYKIVHRLIRALVR